MIKIASSIDEEKWGDFVLNHEQGNIFQTPEMAAVYSRTKNHNAQFIAALDGTDEIKALVLGAIITEKGGLLSGLSTRSVIKGGPLFTGDKSGRSAFKSVMAGYDKCVGKKALYTEIRALHDLSCHAPLMKESGYGFEDHFNAFINLNRPVETIWTGLKKDKRRGIRKAEKSGITLEPIKTRDEVEIAYELIKETYASAKVPLADISFFESLYDVLMPKKMAEIVFAKYKGEHIATQVALLYKGRITALYTGSKREYLPLHPGDMLIWHFLEFGAENNYTLFDFGGGGSPSKNENLRLYKSRFGAEFPNHGRYKKIYSKTKLKIAEMGFNIYRQVF